jgi:biotin carboxylase
MNNDAYKKHILVVGGKNSGFGEIAKLGVRVSLLQTKDNLTPEQIAGADTLITVPEISLEGCLPLVRSLHEIRPIDAIVSFFETCLLPTAQMAEALRIASNPVRPVALTRDKRAMRAIMQDSNLPTLRYQQCETKESIENFLTEIGSAIIVKPVHGSGSRGVFLVQDHADLHLAWSWLEQNGQFPIICEEYIEGPEYSVESFSREGRHHILAITEKLTTGAPNFVETGHQMPARLSRAMHECIRETVCAFLDLIGQEVGPAHTEIRLRNGVPFIIESQTRFGGDQIWELVWMTTGVHLGAETGRVLLGLPALDISPAVPAAAIRFLIPSNCKIELVTGCDEAMASEGVIRVENRLKAGKQLGLLTGSWARQGYVLAVGETIEEAIRHAESAARKILIMTDAGVFVPKWG